MPRSAGVWALTDAASPAPPRAVVLVTRSVGKIRELRAMLAAAGIATEDLTSLGIAEERAEDGLEVFESFEENAMAKARWFARKLPGRAVLADDSGLEVAALDGAPGVRSKRWSGSPLTGAALDAENNAALQRALRGVTDRRARYVCVAVCVRGRDTWCARGESAGRILESPRGAGGFGYDPWFFSEPLERTFAAASAEEKARVSHRGRALQELLRMWGHATEGLRSHF